MSRKMQKKSAVVFLFYKWYQLRKGQILFSVVLHRLRRKHDMVDVHLWSELLCCIWLECSVTCLLFVSVLCKFSICKMLVLNIVPSKSIYKWWINEFRYNVGLWLIKLKSRFFFLLCMLRNVKATYQWFWGWTFNRTSGMGTTLHLLL